jgi:hypothetical protein
MVAGTGSGFIAAGYRQRLFRGLRQRKSAAAGDHAADALPGPRVGRSDPMLPDRA